MRLREKLLILAVGVVLVFLVGPHLGFVAGTVYFAVMAVWR